MFLTTSRKTPAPTSCASTSLPSRGKWERDHSPPAFPACRGKPPSSPPLGQDPTPHMQQAEGGNLPWGSKLHSSVSSLMEKYQLRMQITGKARSPWEGRTEEVLHPVSQSPALLPKGRSCSSCPRAGLLGDCPCTKKKEFLFWCALGENTCIKPSEAFPRRKLLQTDFPIFLMVGEIWRLRN